MARLMDHVRSPPARRRRRFGSHRRGCFALRLRSFPHRERSLEHVYRFALRPRWLVSHLLVLALAVTMVVLGFWQLDRLDERKADNALIEGRSAQPVAPVPDVLDPDGTAGDAESELYRRVTATGTYATEDEVLVRSRSLDGAPGSWVLTPLELDDSTAVVVNRGWVPNSGGLEEAPPEAAAPTGEVSVTGLVYPTQERGELGPVDPAEGELATLARADLGRLQEQVDADLYPAYVQLTSASPEPSGPPQPLGAPELTEGRHFGYAVQWVIFAAVAFGGYPLILRRVARDKHQDAADPSDALEPEDPRLDPVTR